MKCSVVCSLQPHGHIPSHLLGFEASCLGLEEQTRHNIPLTTDQLGPKLLLVLWLALALHSTSTGFAPPEQ